MFNNNEDDEEEIMIENNDEWINKYREMEKEYNIFYKSEVSSIELIFYYINNNNEIEKIRKERIELKAADPNTKKILQKETIIQLIKEKENYNNKKYILNGLLKYNIDIEAIDAIDANEIDVIETNNETSNNFFTTVFYSPYPEEDIIFEKTIDFFQDLNALYIFLKEEEECKKKKIHITTKKRRGGKEAHKKTHKQKIKL